MNKVVYVGNRPSVLKKLIEHNSVNLVKAFIIDQPLINYDNSDDWLERIDAKSDLQKITAYVANQDFDLFVSAGCSYILPVNNFPNNKTYINCHPSVLPWGKGIHPINECFIGEHNLFGATIHYLSAALDGGDIIEQVQYDLTPDIDISLLYTSIFEIEADLLELSINKLIENNFKYIGKKQTGSGSYFSRKNDLVTISSTDSTVENFLNYFRGFSSSQVGIVVASEQGSFRVFSATQINNEFFIDKFKHIMPGNICVKTKDVLVLQFNNGLVYIKKWEKI